MATTRKQFLPLMGLTAALAAGTFGALLLVNPHHHKEETQADREKKAKDETSGVFGGNVENPPGEASTSMPTIPAGTPAAITVQGSNAAGGGCPPGQIPDPNAAGAGTATPASGAAATPASGAAATPSTAAAATPASGAAATPTTAAAAPAGATPASPACIPDPNATAVASSGTGAAATPTTTTSTAPTDGGSGTPGTATTTTDAATNTPGAPAPTDASTTTTASTSSPATPAPAAATTEPSSTTTASSSATSGGSTESASSAGGPSPAELRRMIRREAQKIARDEVRKALRARGLSEDGSAVVAAADKPAKKTKKTTTTTTKATDTAPAATTDTAASTTTDTTTSTDTATSGATPAPSTATATEVASASKTSTTTTKTKSGKSATKTTATSTATTTSTGAGAPSPAGNALTQRPQADALRAWWNDTNTPVGAFTLVYAGQPKNQTSIALLFSDTPALASTASGIKVVDRSGTTIANNWAAAPGNPRLLLLSGLTPGRYTVVVNQNMQSTGGRKLISDQTGPVYIR